MWHPIEYLRGLAKIQGKIIDNQIRFDETAQESILLGVMKYFGLSKDVMDKAKEDLNNQKEDLKKKGYFMKNEDEEEDPESEESPVSKRIVFEQNLNSQSKMEEEVKNFKENSLTNTLRHEPSLNPSKFEHNRSESIQSHSSAFHTINPMNNISFTFREKKLESNTIKSEIKSEGLNKKSETDSFVIKDTKSSQIKDKSESSNSKHKEEGKNKDISLLKDIYKENTENYDYFKLFNVLVNFKEN